ncbi:bifunctional enoyl-CoA hydratase/phosphate acetyltransferase [Candidatus Acidulodesulfobacterium sp. H_13]|uniref:bifunctional enoyl-CoA hydratase/phosphate acetyltransferase n=1 Tax=Candidatus Acidulodesulfobacterium sp. H_13 TaxID=3395470 RepID=UPI003AF67E55
MLKNLSDIVKKAEILSQKRAAIVVSEDDLVIDGVFRAYENRLIIPQLIGNKSKILSFLAAKPFYKKLFNNKNNDIEILNAKNDADAAYIAVKLAVEKKIDIIIKGHIHTDVFMHQLILKENGLRTNRYISHIFVMEIKTYKKLILITDAAVNINPDISEKAQILQNAIDLAVMLGIKRPKAAMLSAVETINPKISSTLDAAIISKMAERGQIVGGIVDGPLAFDNVISKQAAVEKGIKSKVAGDADIIVVPNIESGNILFKDLEYLAGAKVAGIVMGLAVPVVLTSRSDNIEARLYSTALASIVSENYDKFLEYKAWI